MSVFLSKLKKGSLKKIVSADSFIWKIAQWLLTLLDYFIDAKVIYPFLLSEHH